MATTDPVVQHIINENRQLKSDLQDALQVNESLKTQLATTTQINESTGTAGARQQQAVLQLRTHRVQHVRVAVAQNHRAPRTHEIGRASCRERV